MTDSTIFSNISLKCFIREKLNKENRDLMLKWNDELITKVDRFSRGT